MTIERLKELETSLARAYSISGDPELVDVDEHARCYEDIQKLLDREIERQSVTDEEMQEAIETLEDIMPSEREMAMGDYADIGGALHLAIQALKAYRPTESEHVVNSDKLGCGRKL